MIQRYDTDRPAGRPAVSPQTEIITIELSPELSAALDRFTGRDHPQLTRAEAVVAAFRDWASAHGFVAGTDEGLRPDQLNASNDG